ncbi:MAG: hypothetical protein R2726_08700 [Acidimicrobiales bacterium]
MAGPGGRDPAGGPAAGPLLHGLTIGSAPELDPVRRLVDGAVAVLDLDAADRATADGLAAGHRGACPPAAPPAKRRWLAVVTGGCGSWWWTVGRSPARWSPRSARATATGSPRSPEPAGWTLRAAEDLDLLVVDEASLAAVGLVADQGGRTRPAAGPVEEVAIVDVLLADEPAG